MHTAFPSPVKSPSSQCTSHSASCLPHPAGEGNARADEDLFISYHEMKQICSVNPAKSPVLLPYKGSSNVLLASKPSSNQQLLPVARAFYFSTHFFLQQPSHSMHHAKRTEPFSPRYLLNLQRQHLFSIIHRQAPQDA